MANFGLAVCILTLTFLALFHFVRANRAERRTTVACDQFDQMHEAFKKMHANFESEHATNQKLIAMCRKYYDMYATVLRASGVQVSEQLPGTVDEGVGK